MKIINIFVSSLFILLSANAQQSSKKPPKKPTPVLITWVNKPSVKLPAGVTHRTYKSNNKMSSYQRQQALPVVMQILKYEGNVSKWYALNKDKLVFNDKEKQFIVKK